ncbi:MAG: hypothetical protein ACTSRS_03425 [Candidatus Helarchaeota archaeon]
MPETTLFDENYRKLVEKYGGCYILIRQEKVLFADKSANIVLDYALKHFPDRKWKIIFVDSGEAAFYGISLSYKENSLKN